MSSSATTVLGFSFTGSTVPAGCGVLTQIILDDESTGFSEIIFASAEANPLDVSYFD